MKFSLALIFTLTGTVLAIPAAAPNHKTTSTTSTPTPTSTSTPVATSTPASYGSYGKYGTYGNYGSYKRSEEEAK